MGATQARIMREGWVLYKLYLHPKGFPGGHLAPNVGPNDRYWLAFGLRHATWKARRKLARYERRRELQSQEWTVGGAS